MMVQAQQEQGEDNVVDEAVNEEMNDSLVRAATTAVTSRSDKETKSHIMVEFKRISLTGFRSCTSRSRYRSVSKQTTRHLPQSCLMLTLEGFPFITVNTKEYHSDVLAIITRIMRRT
ncbi:hypothetical protein Tco_1446762 [Tanacetum coccineum]